jgi:hypothetical protein
MLSLTNQGHTFLVYFLKIHLIVIPPSAHAFQVVFSLQVFQLNFSIRVLSFPNEIHAEPSPHPPPPQEIGEL